VTSFQRSPVGSTTGLALPRTPSAASSSMSVVTAVRQASGGGGSSATQRLVPGFGGKGKKKSESKGLKSNKGGDENKKPCVESEN
jgi:hypothetical protein